MTHSMLNRKDHRSKVKTGQQVTALVRLSEATDAYDQGHVGREQLLSTCRVAMNAGVTTNVIAEVSGFSRATVESLR